MTCRDLQRHQNPVGVTIAHVHRQNERNKEPSMNRTAWLVVVVIVGAATSVAFAQKPIVYPAKGQTSQQKAKDDADCHAWAKKDTGIDPAAASAPAPQQTGSATGGGERARGAARGAVGGAAIGAIAGDAGAGAGIGAVAGTMGGGRKGAPEAGGAEPAGPATAVRYAEDVLSGVRGVHGRSRLHDQVTR